MVFNNVSSDIFDTGLIKPVSKISPHKVKTPSKVVFDFRKIIKSLGQLKTFIEINIDKFLGKSEILKIFRYKRPYRSSLMNFIG